MSMTRALLLSAALAALLALPALAPAVIPPKNCGRMTVEGKRYQVKADQISCKTAREHTRRYIVDDQKPSGYRCRDITTRRNRVNFMCNRGRKLFFAIRR
jgi:hypothetical protein